MTVRERRKETRETSLKRIELQIAMEDNFGNQLWPSNWRRSQDPGTLFRSKIRPDLGYLSSKCMVKESQHSPRKGSNYRLFVGILMTFDDHYLICDSLRSL